MGHLTIPRSCRRIDVTVSLARARSSRARALRPVACGCREAQTCADVSNERVVLRTITRADYHHFLHLTSLVCRCHVKRPAHDRSQKKNKTCVRLHACNFVRLGAATRSSGLRIAVLIQIRTCGSQSVADCSPLFYLEPSSLAAATLGTSPQLPLTSGKQISLSSFEKGLQ